jgi:ABC-2 type transport system permease protein
MNRTLRAIIGAVLILVIAFSAISLCQGLGRRWKLDITEQKLYTLSPGTKAILARLNQPIRAKLYYAKTAAMHGPDQIRYFNNYYEFVRSLLEEYVAASHGMVQLDVVDPRPFSNEEEAALKSGLKRFAITEEEGFFFGLVIETQFGVEKTIPVFSPDRQTFVEYDISYLIDTAMTRQKKRIGVMSSLPVMGQDVSDYMARMMAAQGQQPTPPWTIVTQLREKYEVKEIPTDVNDINDVDILLVVHPKNLPQRTQFAIDQFVLEGGRTIVCVDPYSFADRPQRNPMQMSAETQSSDLGTLLRTWGLEMSANTFAGDRSLMLEASLNANQRPEALIGFLGLKSPDCFNKDSTITAQLNQVRMLFPGVLREKTSDIKPADPNQTSQAKAEEVDKVVRTPLITTTAKGNSWSVENSFDVMFPDSGKLLGKFADGSKPVAMGYLVTGHLKSSFPQGIEIEEKVKTESGDANEPRTVSKHLTGLTESSADCAVAVFGDVDFLWDQMAYVNYGIFGKAPAGDNAALLLNTIEVLGGSGDLISIRSRGSYRRPFAVVDEIERKADEETANEVAVINAQIDMFNQKLQSLVTSKGDQPQGVIGSTIVRQKRDLELQIHDAQKNLREVKAKRLAQVEQLGFSLRRLDMLIVPSIIAVVAVLLSIWRGMRKRHYISHASDA